MDYLTDLRISGRSGYWRMGAKGKRCGQQSAIEMKDTLVECFRNGGLPPGRFHGQFEDKIRSRKRKQVLVRHILR